jgi:hypothetical protein
MSNIPRVGMDTCFDPAWNSTGVCTTSMYVWDKIFRENILLEALMYYYVTVGTKITVLRKLMTSEKLRKTRIHAALSNPLRGP